MKLPWIFTAAAILSLPTPLLAAAFSHGKYFSLLDLNTTSLNIPPDLHFKINRVYSDEEIVKNDCLVVGFWLMGQLSTKDWSSTIPLGRGPDLANFPGVKIDVKPQDPFPNLPIRYAIWGLKLAMLDLLARNQFVESIYELYWDYVTVGTIYIRASTPRLSNQNLTLPFNFDQSVNIDIQAVPGAQPINPRDIWTTMFESQERLAYPAAHIIPRTAFQLGPYLPSSKAFFNLDPLHGPDLPRLYPPFLHVSTITYALMLIAVWMCQNDRFSEFGFIISVGGTLVGTGRLSEVRTQGGLAGNLSTS